MSNYVRVLPRDLFNESALLKSVGKLWIHIERLRSIDAKIVEEKVSNFDIVQDEADGSISIRNLTFIVKGQKYSLSRNLNSQNSWCLWLSKPDDEDFETIEVLDEEGNLTEEMISFLM
jgi:hypothetical protein